MLEKNIPKPTKKIDLKFRNFLIKDSEFILRSVVKLLHPLKGIVHIITSDNKKEFTDHEEIAKKFENFKIKKYSIVLTETANTMEKRRVVMKPRLKELSNIFSLYFFESIFFA